MLPLSSHSPQIELSGTDRLVEVRELWPALHHHHRRVVGALPLVLDDTFPLGDRRFRKAETVLYRLGSA